MTHDSKNDIFFIIDYETTGVSKTDVPIEVGIIITDSSWKELDRLESLICSDHAFDLPPEYWDEAEKIHGISQETIQQKGIFPWNVAKEIKNKAEQWNPVNGRLILLSDNIQFEWRHTEWLLDTINLQVTDLFHYCGWDTSLLSLFTSFRAPSGTKHRALSDVEGLLEELRRVAQNHQQNTAAVNGWIEFKGNEALFDKSAKNNCEIKFDDGSICHYNDDHPRAIMTHFKIKP